MQRPNEWHWFNEEGTSPKQEYIHRAREVKDYKAIARDRSKALKEIHLDSNVLFREVDYNDFEGDILFIHWLMHYKTITEQDLLAIPNLDWFHICEYVPLSTKTLELYQDKVNWDEISESHFYDKHNYDFINKFHAKLNWKKIKYIRFDPDDAYDLVFHKHAIPFDVAIEKRLLAPEHVLQHQRDLQEYVSLILYWYGADIVDQMVEVDIEEELAREQNAIKFVDSCAHKKYLPVNYARIVSIGITKMKQAQVTLFLTACKPDEEFIKKYIITCQQQHILDAVSSIPLSDEFVATYTDILSWKHILSARQFPEEVIAMHLDHITAEVISKSQKLSPEFIDAHSEQLDWFLLCEFQTLPEWLMRKHADKLNWGQVSWYQRLSQNFIDDYKKNINFHKLAINKSYYT